MIFGITIYRYICAWNGGPEIYIYEIDYFTDLKEAWCVKCLLNNLKLIEDISVLRLDPE